MLLKLFNYVILFLDNRFEASIAKLLSFPTYYANIPGRLNDRNINKWKKYLAKESIGLKILKTA